MWKKYGPIFEKVTPDGTLRVLVSGGVDPISGVDFGATILADSTQWVDGYLDLQVPAKAEIDIAAGKARLKYITEVPGQASTYAEKAADAAAFIAAGNPADTTAFPWVSAEASSTGTTPALAAAAIITQKQQWAVVGSAIESARRTGKLAVDAATNSDSLISAKEAAISALAVL